MEKIIKRFCGFIAFFVISSVVCAQADISSPYSRFGIGDVRMNRTNAAIQGMGGLSSTYFGNTYINPANPASYAFIDSLSFVFDVSLYYKTAKFETKQMDENSSNASLDNANFAFSVTKHWKTGLGLAPLSSMEYEVLIEKYNETGYYCNFFEGNGGLNEVYWSNGFRILDNLAVGVDAAYIFGTLKEESTIYYPDSMFFLNGRRTFTNKVKDFRFTLGAIYTLPMKGGNSMTFGLTYKFKNDLNVKRDAFIRNMFVGYGDNVETPVDTFLYAKDQSSSIKMPHSITGGVSFNKGDRLRVGIDFTYQNWKGFEYNGRSDSIQDAWSVMLGASYCGSHSLAAPYHKRMTFRAGLHFDRTYYKLYGENINKFGIAAGFSLPLPRSYTMMNISFEYGQLGTTSKDLIKQKYFQLTVGMSIHDKWFVKRRYK